MQRNSERDNSEPIARDCTKLNSQVWPIGCAIVKIGEKSFLITSFRFRERVE